MNLRHCWWGAVIAALWIGKAVAADTNSNLSSSTVSQADRSGSLLQDYRNSVVLIKNKTSAGSGFIFTRAGRRFLVSNAHIFAGIKTPAFKTLDNSVLQFSRTPAMIAVGHDVLMMELQPGTNGIPLIEGFGETVVMNDPVVVYGNTGGEDVVTALKGKLVGIGTDRVEVSAEFEPGNSGSPIVHLPSGSVIGVAAYLVVDDLISGEQRIRRFGFRLDTIRQWEAVNWARFHAEAEQLRKIEETTDEMKQVFFELNGLNQRSKKVRVYAYESPSIRTTLDDFYTSLNRSNRREDADRAVDSLLAAMQNISRNYATSARPVFTYDYFRRSFAEQETVRTTVMKLLVDIFKK